MEASGAGLAPAVVGEVGAPSEGQVVEGQVPQNPIPGQSAPQAPQPTGQQEVSSTQQQLDAMTARVEAAEAQLAQQGGQGQQQQGQQEGEQGLLDLLEGYGGEQEPLSPEELAQYQQGGEIAPEGDGNQDLGELRSLIREEAEAIARAAVDPILQGQQNRELDALQDKYPDITKPEVFGPMSDTLQELEEQFGEDARLSPKLVELAYTAVKARQSDAGSTPAEEAATQGASLETQAGQSQAGEVSDEDAYANALAGVSAGGSEFE